MISEGLLKDYLSRFEQLPLCKGPSPVQKLDNLRSKWGLGFDLYVKRDDLMVPPLVAINLDNSSFCLAMLSNRGQIASFTAGLCSQIMLARYQLPVPCMILIAI